MSRLWIGLLIASSATGFAQQLPSAPSQDVDLMLAAISRDQYMFTGGIGPSKMTAPGTVAVEPLAQLTMSGEWKNLPCTPGGGKGCLKFAHEYLSRPHLYSIVSADGKGATIHSAPTTLSECYDFSGRGTYSGVPIAHSAIAASTSDFFADSIPPRQLDKDESNAVRKALGALIPKTLDSTEHLGLFALRLEGRDMLVIQRVYADGAEVRGRYKFVFAIGTVVQGRFHILHWKKDAEDEQERVLGTIRLKNGRDFLVTVVSDPESHSFRVYGIRDGHLALIYSGGGSSC